MIWDLRNSKRRTLPRPPTSSSTGCEAAKMLSDRFGILGAGDTAAKTVTVATWMPFLHTIVLHGYCSSRRNRQGLGDSRRNCNSRCRRSRISRPPKRLTSVVAHDIAMARMTLDSVTRAEKRRCRRRRLSVPRCPAGKCFNEVDDGNASGAESLYAMLLPWLTG
jgi:hypothetical protein